MAERALAIYEKTPRAFRLIFEVRGGRSFLEIEGKKEAHSTSVARRCLRFTRHVSDAASLAPERRAATELHNARLECDWSDGKTIVSKIRPHNAVYCGLDRPLQRSVSLI
jgi:hypothetical protein